MRLTDNFWLEEFHCKDGVEVPDELIDNVTELADSLQELRDYIQRPITINSAYRHESYNASIGGSVNSQHLQAKAADLKVSGVSPRQLADAIEYLISEGRMKQGGLGRYKSFTHYDIRGTRARWGKN
jgi:uncharacterized protein YcbK (DUF882 family)